MATIFIASPYFPPSPLPPAQRARLLVRHLHEFGWQPVIFTVDPRYREEAADPWMLDIAGNDYRKIEVKALDQRKTRKFGIGDLGIRVFFHLFFSLVKNARKEKPALIVYPVPPWYIMVMAPFVKRLTGVPYLIDFIDPWVFKTNKKDTKSRISQWLAHVLERRVVKKSDGIVAVSQGILNDLVERYPSIKEKPMAAAPYGVEASDFQAVQWEARNSPTVLIRYTGALSEAMLPVVDTLFSALKIVDRQVPLQVIFTGTSYAGAGRAKPVTEDLMARNGVASFVVENPGRVGYKEALQLNMSADLQLLIGDTTPYYAASKLMGLVASGRPFFAFVHKESFPSVFLEQLGYPYKTVFEPEELGTEKKITQLAADLLLAIRNKDSFTKIDTNNPILAQYTAHSMTKTFSDIFKKIVHEQTAL